jgi:dTDP-4-amino-4,6-dideoxygalactose transaminase
MTRRVPFVDAKKAYLLIRNDIDAAYADVMANGELIDRRHLKEFEERLAAFVGTKYAIGLNSGYDALHLSLRAAGIGRGDEVIVPAHTFVATTSAIVNVGATPKLVDVGKDFNIDAGLIAAAITPRTKAILPVHLSGKMADMDRIEAIAAEHRLVIVEDACQSLGATIAGRSAGAIGLTGCWSFYPFKILGAYGDGGAITTNDPGVAQFVRRMRYNGEDRATGEYHGHGFTCLLDNLQAAFLTVKLARLPVWIERCKQIAARYHARLGGLPGLLLPRDDDARFDHVYQNYTVRSTAGDAFSDHLKANGIEVLTQFRKPYYRHEALGLTDTGFPETEALSREVCSLPIYPELDDDDVEYVCAVVRRFHGLE